MTPLPPYHFLFHSCTTITTTTTIAAATTTTTTTTQKRQVVVGHPSALALDPCWRRLLEHAADRGGWFGAGCPELGVGLNGTDPASGTESGTFLEHVHGLLEKGGVLLGGAAAGDVYPDLGSLTLGGESQWRVML